MRPTAQADASTWPPEPRCWSRRLGLRTMVGATRFTVLSGLLQVYRRNVGRDRLARCEGVVMAVRLQRTAVALPGKGPAASAFAAEIAQYSTEALGIPTTWGVLIGDTYGTYCWFSDYADMAEFEVGIQRSMTDERFNELVNEGEQLFVEGSGEDRVVWMP